MDGDIQGVFVIRIHHNMAFALSSQNINVTAFNFGSEPTVLTPKNIESGLKSLPKLFPNRSFLHNIRDAFALSKSIKASKPDIVHVNALQDLLPAFFAVRMSGLNSRRPAVVAMSRNSLSWESPKRAWLYAKLIKFFSDGFIALATTHKDQLLKFGISEDKVTVIPNPYDPACLKVNGSSSREEGRKTLKITYVAHICENKSQDVLIDAAAIVLKKCPEVKFELIGKVLQGQEKFAAKLKSMIKEYGIEQSIEFIGELPFESVLVMVKKSDLFVFPTQVEMMPRAVIEAMAMGKPVIASAVDGILDLIQNRKTGLLVQPGNAADLADAISELIKNPGLAKTLGAAGQAYILDICSPERVGKQFSDFYKHLRPNRKSWLASFASSN